MNLQERVFGTECEYAPVYHGRITQPPSSLDEAVILEYHHHLACALRCGLDGRTFARSGEFMGNGGRLYMDRGGHPEFATAECRTVTDLLAHEKAGDRIIQRLAEAIRCHHNLHIYKNNVDAEGHSYGGHENYLIAAKGMDAIDRLIPFLSTRQIFAGSGKIDLKAPDGSIRFQISQRADFIDQTYSDRTNQVRGIINIRKREITDAGQNQRLHLIVGDSNLCEVAIALKVATTALMLRLLEETDLCDAPVLDAAPAALKATSRDLTATLGVLVKGRRVHWTALEIQQWYLEKALGFYTKNNGGDEASRWLALWQDTLKGLAELKVDLQGFALESDPADLKRKIDWVLKLWLLERARAKGADRLRLRLMDMTYHDLDRQSGLFERCQALDLVDRLVDEEQIERAQFDPPKDTRARLRGLVIQATLDKNVDVLVENWETIHVRARQKQPGAHHFFRHVKGGFNSLTIRVADPLQSQDPGMLEELERFIETWG
jgi:proteasome accessory factor A